eukprot:TRINITY_DN5440_c0_g1_i3.p1 TRINITY_DN5440_c0_g1~~TRINITY_DN5440_c0_g1_i3.p1  ORF type:complete len:181 (+),score=41.81 TRINITY_DN5440_c0_g1_i3:212-754(+)
MVRAMSFNLFGKLASLIDKNAANFKATLDQVHYNLVSVALHTQDDSKVVKQSCLATLQKIFEVLEIPFEEAKETPDHPQLDKSDQLLVGLAEVIVSTCPEKLTDYLSSLADFCNSPEDSIKAASGFLMAALISCSGQNLSKHDDRILTAFTGLSLERSSLVKIRLMKAYTLLEPSPDSPI